MTGFKSRKALGVFELELVHVEIKVDNTQMICSTALLVVPYLQQRAASALNLPSITPRGS